MENQHRQITGYRQLTEGEIAAMNAVKHAGEDTAQLIGQIEQSNPDMRWVSIARTHLQQGFMALTRAIAKPTTF